MRIKEENLTNKIINLIFLLTFIVFFIISLVSFFTLFPFQFPLFIFPLIFITLYAFAEKATHNTGYFIAIFSGFWTDIFSYLPFGFFMICFFIITHTIKFLLQRYVNF